MNREFDLQHKKRMMLHLQEKEIRAGRQKHLYEQFHLPILSFMLNIPGEQKQSDEIEKTEKICWARLKRKLCGKIKAEEFFSSPGGNYYLAAVDMEAVLLKRLVLCLEEEQEIGRLLDFDVFDENFDSVSRTMLGYPLRKCLICQRPAKICMRERKHSTKELTAKVESIMIDFNRREEYEEKN